MDYRNITLGEKINLVVDELGLATQYDLERLSWINQSTISRVKNGSEPKERTIMALSPVLDKLLSSHYNAGAASVGAEELSTAPAESSTRSAPVPSEPVGGPEQEPAVERAGPPAGK